MRFQLVISCNNAAFEGDKMDEVARILRAVAERLDVGGWPDTETPVRDANGNTVGGWAFVDE